MFSVQVETLDDYFNYDRERKADLEAVDTLISKTVPDLKRWFYNGSKPGEAGMRMKLIGYGAFYYKVKTGQTVKWPIIGLALQKNYISLYVSATNDDGSLVQSYKDQLGEVRMGNGNFSFIHFDQLNQHKLISLLKAVDTQVKNAPDKSLKYSRVK